MYISLEYIQKALSNLESVHPFYGTTFLACKRESLPVGRVISFAISTIETQILDEFYRPDVSSNYFFRVFTISDKGRRWVRRDKYPTSTLQSMRTRGAFSEPFIHDSNTDKWGWKSEYINILKDNLSRNSPPFRNQRVPVFDLAVWLYRSREWPQETNGEDLVSTFLSEFRIEPKERDAIFDVTIPLMLDSGPLLTDQPISWKDLQRIIGYPPDSKPEEGAALQFLELKSVGSVDDILYEPSERLNIITGDNGLGKTFLFEVMWWALTGEWLDYPAIPRRNVPKSRPEIAFQVGSNSQRFTSEYSWNTLSWKAPSKRDALPGLVIYARYDGSFAVWDPARIVVGDQRNTKSSRRDIFLAKRDVWEGLREDGRVLCNGLIQDWVSWQTGGERYREHYNTLVACLRALSPSEDEPLTPGSPTRVRDARDVPTLRMYGDEVPVILASAGVQRVLSLAYMLVWAWREHLANSEVFRRKPQRNIVLIVDEIEAHLHPRWQRTVIPSLISVVSQLGASVSAQLHIATHSPMVMASAETVFNEDTDELHHLRLESGKVRLEELPFVKRGRADLWLMSDAFGLGQPRSLRAEEAINDAKTLQLANNPDPSVVREVNSRLVQYLAPDDDFWPRWRYFAEKHGLDQ